MVARLGNVLYWLGCGIAALLCVFDAFFLITALNAHSEPTAIIGLSVLIFAFAVVAWLAGLAFKYILAGR